MNLNPFANAPTDDPDRNADAPFDTPAYDEAAFPPPDAAAAGAPAAESGAPARRGAPGFVLFIVLALSLGILAVSRNGGAPDDPDEALRQLSPYYQTSPGRHYNPQYTVRRTPYGVATRPGTQYARPNTTQRPFTNTASSRPAPVAGRGYESGRANYAYGRSAALNPLARRLGSPRPGEWRAIARESPESFYQFVNQPQRPTFPAGRRTLGLVPLGDQSLGSQFSVGPVAEFMAAYFGMPTRVHATLPLQQLPRGAMQIDGRGRRLVAEYCIENVLRPRLPADGGIMVGLTANDLTPGGPWAFESAFGWSSFYGRAAVVSTARVVPASARRGATTPELEHIVKLALHEACHAFSLKHCSRHECLVNGRCSLEENARKPLWLCPECHAKLMYAAGFDPVVRANRLAALCQKYGFRDAAAYHQRAAAALQQKR